MKINKKLKIKTRLFLELIGKICIVTMLVGLIYFILSFFEDTFARLLSQLDYNLYWRFVHNRKSIEIFILILIIGIVIFKFISKYVNSINEVYNSFNRILKEDNETIKITNDIYRFSDKINQIKYDYIIAKQNQRDSEQKKNDLIMYMAHDLKTPLTSIIGYLTLLTDEKEISKNLQNKYMKIALDKSLRVEELINQFFDITRYNLHEMQINKNEINLTFMLQQLIDECYPMLDSNNLKCELTSPEKVMYKGDGDKLARAFDNLLKNAINYSYENTTINIIVVEKIDKITILFKNKGDKIPDYKLDKIFEKFYRGDDSRTSKTGGAGLGLAITKEIIELHNGAIKVKNDDEFIEFYIELKTKY